MNITVNLDDTAPSGEDRVRADALAAVTAAFGSTADVAALAFNPDQERAEDGKFGSGGGTDHPAHVSSQPAKPYGGIAHEIKGTKADKAEGERLLGTLHKDAQELLRRAPLAQLSLGGIRGRADGMCYGLRGIENSKVCIDAKKIAKDHIDGGGLAAWNPRPGDVDRPWSVSAKCGSAGEQMATSFAHEVGHALTNMSNAAEEVMRAHYVEMYKHKDAVSSYALTNHREYFAECFALYNHDEFKLRSADRIGWNMVTKVKTMLKKGE